MELLSEVPRRHHRIRTATYYKTQEAMLFLKFILHWITASEEKK